MRLAVGLGRSDARLLQSETRSRARSAVPPRSATRRAARLARSARRAARPAPSAPRLLVLHSAARLRLTGLPPRPTAPVPSRPPAVALSSRLVFAPPRPAGLPSQLASPSSCPTAVPPESLAAGGATCWAGVTRPLLLRDAVRFVTFSSSTSVKV